MILWLTVAVLPVISPLNPQSCLCSFQAVEAQIRSFGQTPSQLLIEPHPPRGSAMQAVSAFHTPLASSSTRSPDLYQSLTIHEVLYHAWAHSFTVSACLQPASAVTFSLESGESRSAPVLIFHQLMVSVARFKDFFSRDRSHSCIMGSAA